MKNKKVGFFVCMLLIATAISAFGETIKQNNIQGIDDCGGMVRQIPYDTNDPKVDFWPSCTEPFYHICYENFFDVDNPISTVHCWGHIGFWDFEKSKLIQREHEGMVFDIVFYEDDMGKPGNEICSYTNIIPTIVKTGMIYKYPWATGLWNLYHLKYDLNPSCSLSNGWISIRSSNSPNNCSFVWATSPDGDGRSLLVYKVQWSDIPDLALILSDEKEAYLEIDIKGGFGSKIEITNNGAETLFDLPIDVIVSGGLFRQINVHFEEVISTIEPGEKTTISLDTFLGLGKIAIGVIVGDVVEYFSGRQLLILTMVV